MPDIILYLCLFSIIVIISSYPLELIEAIADKLEINISKPKLSQFYDLLLEDFVFTFYDIIPTSSYGERKISNNTSNGDMISYFKFHITYFFKINITQTGTYPKSIIRELTADEQLLDFSLKRIDDNSFTYYIGEEISKYTVFGSSDLFNYKFVQCLFKNKKKIEYILHVALSDFYDMVLVHFPPSFAVYYFDHFINNMISSSFFFDDVQVGQRNAIKFKSIKYEHIRKINQNTAEFFNVTFILEVLLNRQWRKIECTTDLIRFGQTEVEHFIVNFIPNPKELTYMINSAFQRKFIMYQYYKKYQDPSETVKDLL